MKQRLAGVILGLAISLFSAVPAQAGPWWCEDDPVIHFAWGGVHLSTQVQTSDPSNTTVYYDVNSTSSITVTYPQSGSVGSVVRYHNDPSQPAGSALVTVSVVGGTNGSTTVAGAIGGTATFPAGSTFTLTSAQATSN